MQQDSTRPMTRRAVVVAGAGAGVAALAAACTSGGGSSSEPGDNRGRDPGGDSGQPLADTADIPTGGGTVFADREVVVTQPERGRFQGFSATCTHQGCTVADVSGGTINCACHGSKFRIADGSVASGPAQRPLPDRQITVVGGAIRLA